MGNSIHIPTSLKIVAALFILVGALSAIDIVVALMRGRIEPNFHVLGLLIGPGLLWLKRGWRTCARVLLWIRMVTLAIIAVDLLGCPIALVTKGLLLLATTIGFALTCWQYRVLIRSDIRRLFGVEVDEPASGV